MQAVLAARIDRLPPEDKRLLQTASVIGKDVPFALLQAIADEPEDDLRARHRRACRPPSSCTRRSLFPDLEYTFKHALTHEVAYGSLLQDRRRALHGRIVDAHRAALSGPPGGARRAARPPRLPRRAVGQGGDLPPAGGRDGAGRSAHRDAVLYLERALTALSHLPETRETQQQAIDLRFDLRHSLFPLAEFEQIERYLREAEAFARTLDDQRALGWVHAYMSGHYMGTGGRLTEMRTLAERAGAIGEALDDVPLQIAAQYYRSYVSSISGDYQGSEDGYRKLVQWLQGDRIRERFGLLHFPAVTCRAYLARTLAERGQFDEGRTFGYEAIGMAETLDHPYSLVVACRSLAYVDSIKGELDQASRLLERAIALCRDWSIPASPRWRWRRWATSTPCRAASRKACRGSSRP